MGEEAVGSHHGQRDHHQVAELEVFGDVTSVSPGRGESKLQAAQGTVWQGALGNCF